MKTLKCKGGVQYFAGIALATGNRGFMGDAVVRELASCCRDTLTWTHGDHGWGETQCQGLWRASFVMNVEF